ncbi:MAG: hypothetical protein NTX28_10105 [Novosphingobium sp.]|nr:hypothetical protein [Novosphingobium sp.]
MRKQRSPEYRAFKRRIWMCIYAFVLLELIAIGGILHLGGVL